MEPSREGGMGEVHAHLSSQPDKGDGMSGKFYGESEPRGSSRQQRSYTKGMRDQADSILESARERTSDFRERFGERSQSARARAGRVLNDAEEALDEHTGMLSSARDNPLVALGIAFAIGFVLAGSGDPERHPSLAKTKNQIKGAIMGGVSAAISQQLRTYIEDQGGVGALLSSLGVAVPDDPARRSKQSSHFHAG